MEPPLGLFILSNVLVPHASIRLHVFEDRYKALITDCVEQHREFGVLLDRNGREVGEDLHPFEIGTTASIEHVSKLSAGRLYVIASGKRRFRVQNIVSRTPYRHARVAYLSEELGHPDAGALRELCLQRLRCYLELLLEGCGATLDGLDLPSDPIAASYIIADTLQVDPARKQELLEGPSASVRLGAELALLEQEIKHLRGFKDRRRESAAKTKGEKFAARFSRN
jgi:uncharacterized protein